MDSLDQRSLGDFSCRGREERGGVLIIVPEMRFSCYGTITAWSGLISVEADLTNSRQIPEGLQLHLQVWRPLLDNTFDLVGSDLLVFNSEELSEVSSLNSSAHHNITHRERYYYEFSEKEGNSTSGKGSGGISFQQGDVIGCYIPSAGAGEEGGVSRLLGLAFRNASSRDEGEMGTEMMVYSVKEDPCEAFGCDLSPVLFPSALPLLLPHYDVSDNTTSQGDKVGFGGGSLCNSSTSSCPERTTCSGKVVCVCVHVCGVRMCVCMCLCMCV